MISKLVKTLRTLETHAKYELHLTSGHAPAGCYLCRAKPIKAYKHWKIIENEFPYDEVATESHILVPLRHAKEEVLGIAARREYKKIRGELHEKYDMIAENTHKQKSIPEHYHLHLMQIRERLLTIDDKRPQAVFLTPGRMATKEPAP